MRAYVYIEPGVTDFAIGKRPIFSITLKNGGETPAFDFSVALNGQILPFPQKEPMKGKGIQLSPVTETHDGIGAFIYKTHEITLSNPPAKTTLSKSDYDDVIEGSSKRLYVWGRVLYVDAFNKHHHLNFCYTIDGDALSKGATHYCVDYNDTDHGGDEGQ